MDKKRIVTMSGVGLVVKEFVGAEFSVFEVRLLSHSLAVDLLTNGARFRQPAEMVFGVRSVVMLCLTASWPFTLAAEPTKTQKSQKRTQPSDASGPTGEGLLLLDVDYETGQVTRVKVLRSTGQKSVDNRAADVVRRWQIKPKTYTQIRVPVNLKNLFSTGDVEKYLAPRARENSVVIHAPPPRYPMQMLQMGASARGMYRLAIRPDGTVSDVKIVETTGDGRFDQSAISALRLWKFRPRAVETFVIPISFNFNHGYYKVELR